MFWVSLIKIISIDNEDAQQDLVANCTHVYKDYWIMEGDVEFLSKGIQLSVITEGAVPSLGGLSTKELIQICKDYLDYHIKET